jgi:glutathione peroxidase
MLLTIVFLAFVQRVTGQVVHRPAEAPPGKPFPYELRLKTLDGRETDLTEYRGKKLLIVNVASECGYTYQYKDLQALHERYGDRVQVLAFPSNQYGSQEPGTDAEILSFCKSEYQVTFPVFSKGEVRGPGKSPLYRWLTGKDENGWNTEEPGWNFCKYLVDENGVLVAWFGSKVKPLDEAILKMIE